ncbi:MAG: hypothetical protein PHD15_02155 [Clostridia bacterium]|nr:hypothetical protein [Clostridia bacterium]MDD4386551.1 hypothetical protein [Clostridia bacterium]
MNFAYIFKIIFISFFIFVLIYAISFISMSKVNLDSNNSNVKNSIKEAINIGDLRVNDNISFNEDILIDKILDYYEMNNKEMSDDITFRVYKNSNIITVEIIKTKKVLNNDSTVEAIFSYEVIKNE